MPLYHFNLHRGKMDMVLYPQCNYLWCHHGAIDFIIKINYGTLHAI